MWKKMKTLIGPFKLDSVMFAGYSILFIDVTSPGGFISFIKSKLILSCFILGEFARLLSLIVVLYMQDISCIF